MKKFISALAVSLFVIAVQPRLAHANVQDFVINDFKASYTLTNTDKQGSLHVVENINVTFSDYNHGILRAIPNSYKGHSLRLKINHVSSSSNAPSQYATSSANGNTILKIGDPNRTVTGAQQYTIDYSVKNVIGFYDNHDELFWDINGDQWQQPFERLSASVHMPEGLKLSNNQPICFAGAAAATGGCSITLDDARNSLELRATSNKGLTAGQTMTIVAGFQKGYFAPETLSEKFADFAPLILPIILIPLAVGTYAYQRWRKFGRDPKGAGTIVPFYEPPDDLRPMEVGALLHFKASNTDMSATIVDLAVRGYIKILETKKDRLIGRDKLDYSFEMTGKDETGLLPYEISILSGISATRTAGVIVPINELKNKFYTTAAAAQKEVGTRLVKNGFLLGNPLTAGSRLIVLFFLCFAAGFIFLSSSVGVAIGLMIGGGLCMIFAILMPARTVKGVAAKDAVNGLKLYLNTAEKDRLAMLQAANAPYAQNHEAPAKTVDLFEKLLPYAMVLGVEQTWGDQFKDIYTTPPDWYSGNSWNGFNSGLFVGALSSSMNTIGATAFSAPSSSGGSGFGGGGGAGGGGGGGGGGGW